MNCLQFENQGLLEALNVEKKKRVRGKWLNLLGEEDNGPRLFSPSGVYKRLICGTTDDTTYEAVCLIACPELYIRGPIHQLAQDRTVEPGVWRRRFS